MGGRRRPSCGGGGAAVGRESRQSGDLLLDRLNLQQYATEELDEISQTPQSSTAEEHPQLTKSSIWRTSAHQRSSPSTPTFICTTPIIGPTRRANSAGTLPLQRSGDGLITA